jgi:hypothetical protein
MSNEREGVFGANDSWNFPESICRENEELTGGKND